MVLDEVRKALESMIGLTPAKAQELDRNARIPTEFAPASRAPQH